MPNFDLTLSDIFQAHKRIQPIITHTPVLESGAAGKIAGTQVYLKLENAQQTTSFKIRGAANKLLSLSDAERSKGVITTSSGNHGKAVAYVASRLGIRAVVGLGLHVPANKVRSIQGYGAEALVTGENWEETSEQVEKVRKERGLTYIDPFDDPQIIAGQGTLALEALQRYPQIDTIVTPLSGGGLAGGIALAAKSINPRIRVIGVSQQDGAAMYLSIRAGRVVDVTETPSLADALLGGIGQNNRYTFEICRALLDETVLVSEDEIAQAMAFMLEEHHQVVEGAGAVGVAALLNRRATFGSHTLVVVSGGSVDIALLMKIMQKHLSGEQS